MHATIDAQFTVSLDQDKTLPLATLAESLTEIQLEATLSSRSSLEASTTSASSRRTVVRNMRAETATAVSSALEPPHEPL